MEGLGPSRLVVGQTATHGAAKRTEEPQQSDIAQILVSLRHNLASDQEEGGGRLSQGDLVLCLNKLNDHIHSLKGQVYEAIGQGYDEFIQTFDNAANVEMAIAELASRLDAITKQVEDPQTGIHAVLVQPALELTQLTQRATLTGELIQTVTVLQELNDKLNAFTRAMDAFALPTAAKLTSAIGELIRRLPTDQDSQDVPAVFVAIKALVLTIIAKKRHKRRCERLKSRLGTLLRQALVFDATSVSYSPLLTVHLGKQEEDRRVVTVPLTDIIEALDSVDEEEPSQSSLRREMEEFVCQSLRKGALHFIIAHAFSGQRWEVVAEEEAHRRLCLVEKHSTDADAAADQADAADKSSSAKSVDRLFAVLGSFFVLLSSHVFANDGKLLELLGLLLWEPLCHDIVSKVLSPAIPSDTAELAKYQRETIQSTEKFEDQMIALGIVKDRPEASSSSSTSLASSLQARRLSRFVNNVDNHFAIKKQKRILNRARNLLLNQEANVCLKEVCTANMIPDVSSFLSARSSSSSSTAKRKRSPRATLGSEPAGDVDTNDDIVDNDEREEEGLRRIVAQSRKGECSGTASGGPAAAAAAAGEEAEPRIFIFQMPTCQVSASAIGLVILVHHTLEEACRLRHSAPQCAHTLQQTARDLFDLFRAVMPLQYQKETVKAVPSLAMAFHNDCFYLALHLLTLGMQYQDRLPKDKGPFTLVDLVPVFYQLGEKQYQEQVDKQQTVLAETVQSAQGLADTHLRVRYMTVERAMKRVVHHLTHLSRVWKDVLPRHVYLRTLGVLLDAVLEDLIEEFEKLSDISEEETHHLHELLSLLLDCPSFFAPEPANQGEGDGVGNSGGDSAGEATQQVLVERGQEEIKRHACRWSKFVKMVNILDSKLVVIVDAYAKGLMPEFEAEELKSIIRALFSDSPLRKSQLALIK